ncbi:MAG: RNA-binding transcriptional accessory protein [Ahniella sp.]|nr:RNA-binding transcriptional accessory protein [Ahniella sp.]
MLSIEHRIAEEIGARPLQVSAAIQLLDSGATVPFIARYRKEVTEGLDDTQLRTLEERLGYLRELEDRRRVILESIESQGKMTDVLRGDLLAADSKARLEDLYLPYKPKRRTKAQIAREAGLEPLADELFQDRTLDPSQHALGFVDAEKGVADAKAALEGARHILMERWSEEPALVGNLRDWMWDQGQLRAKVIDGKQTEGAKFRDYFDHVEAMKNAPSHRLLAMMRGRNEGFLDLELVPVAQTIARHAASETPFEEIAAAGHKLAEGRVAAHLKIDDRGRPADTFLIDCARMTWRVKLHVHLTLDLFGKLRESAEEEAIRVFAANLKDLLMAAPAGPKVVLGLDPGLRTGVKIAAVDATGKVLTTGVIYPHAPMNRWDEAISQLGAGCKTLGVQLVSIGNGTASRETDELVAALMKKHPDLKLAKIVVSEAGASVYSASEVAAKEFPDMDVSLRGAVSIARRLQDPLAELVKIDPKAIGVGQYQHDVNQIKLARSLDAVVEDCVNAVGVDLNTASAALLARVSGLSSSVAENIVKYRDQHGAFRTRQELTKVPRLGDKAFEQAAGFLRIPSGDNPLDASGVHPEAYPVVERILAKSGRDIRALIGDTSALKKLNPADFTDEKFGLPTVTDILRELEKPGRDPRPEFSTPTFAEGVHELNHLKPGMVLEGRISNVAAFGAFVDIGVHQDGLVHVSALSTKYVKDPREVVKTGDIVKVKVIEVDLLRKRVALTMRMDDPIGEAKPGGQRDDTRGVPKQREFGPKPVTGAQRPPAGGALADAFSRAKRQ